ncbi:MAG TPA: DegT/DnrJ/EryC1/StrS family aminotransferase [Candidatus Dormibacteraeota bacterium]|nr:DegT/DnrJ/EryC1/StrS family aminotransferase [Candidatus Dormibacteraeota bacterium]
MQVNQVQAPRPDSTIPLADLTAQHQRLGAELRAAIDRVFATSDFILGKEVQEFEAEFAAYCGASYAMGCANGTDALELALGALGIGPGDEVITVSHTFAATAEAIVRSGAIPRFVDIDPQTLLMDVSKLEEAITPHTRAIIPVHLYGSCVDMAAVMGIARRHGISVIEDSAQAQGATSRGKKAGATGDLGCFSFYPGKNLGACGDAGAVITSDPELASRVRESRDHGRAGKKYEHVSVGRNSRMDGLQGAILRVKLAHLDAWNARRREIAALYRASLTETGVVAVAIPPTSVPVYHQFVIKTLARDAFRQALEVRGIQTGIHYPIPLHRQPAFAPFVERSASDALRATDAAAASIVSLPMFPELSDGDVQRVASAVAESMEVARIPAA